MSGYGHNTNAQCMDLVVTTRCWTHDHMQYVLPPLLMLPPYYLLAFHLKLTSQVRSDTKHDTLTKLASKGHVITVHAYFNNIL